MEKSRAGLREELEATLRTRIMLFDGAMGTMIQRRKLMESDFHGILDFFSPWKLLSLIPTAPLMDFCYICV